MARRREGAKPPPKGVLTDREREVLQQVLFSGSNAKAAKVLGVGLSTVDETMGRVRHKLKVESTAQAVLVAYKARMIEF